MQTHTTRRAALFGAVASVAAISVASCAAQPALAGSSSPTRSAWDAAVATVERERARDAILDARHKQAQADGTLTDALEAEWSQSADPVCEAEWALFATRAPDLAAVEWKVAMIRDFGLCLDEDIASTILADLRHLRGEN